MCPTLRLSQAIRSDSFLEFAFLRWVLTPAVDGGIISHLVAQQSVEVDGRAYRVDYELIGSDKRISIELDGFAFHGDWAAFTYDRLRQNDLMSTGRTVLRFSYDAIRTDTVRCVTQLQTVLRQDSLLNQFVIDQPRIEQPEMDPDPIVGLNVPHGRSTMSDFDISYFNSVRHKLNHQTLRECQRQAYAALTNYYRAGGLHAACVMSVGAGKTALGVAATLSFSRRRALIVTPGSVIRGTFEKAFDHEVIGNTLYGLPGGPLIPGVPPPRVLTLDRETGAIKDVTREELLDAHIIVTNFHSLGSGEDPDDLLSKLGPDDIDFIVVDEAHIAASESYQRTFQHFCDARTLLMSACFQRLDGKPIDADVVYRYRLIDSIADGNAKSLRLHRFAPHAEQTAYEMVWPDGRREEIIGREAMLAVLDDERKLARITAKSHEPIRQIMRATKAVLAQQAELLHPVKPRVLFSAMGERHAEQLAAIANSEGIPTSYLHYSMTEARIRAIRGRFEQESGDLQGIVQLKMLGQGYDFPPITVVVPMRPYGSFSEFYQFIGRGIRVITHPALRGRIGPERQFLDIVYHAEMGIDEHIDTIYRENDMDPVTIHEHFEDPSPTVPVEPLAGTRGSDSSERPDAFVVFEQGDILNRVVHDAARVEQRRREREQEALAQRYSAYAQQQTNPISFEQFVAVVKGLSGEPG